MIQESVNKRTKRYFEQIFTALKNIFLWFCEILRIEPSHPFPKRLVTTLIYSYTHTYIQCTLKIRHEFFPTTFDVVCFVLFLKFIPDIFQLHSHLVTFKNNRKTVVNAFPFPYRVLNV